MSLQSRAAQADLLQELLSDEQSNECQELQNEAGGALGDPRRCRRHPNVVTSSPDGMFDAPCGACEAAMESGE